MKIKELDLLQNMNKAHNIPQQFASPLISSIKKYRKKKDPRKLDFSPTILNFDTFKIKLAKNFGFCFGVENAINIAYRAVREHPNKRVFLLGEMIHNPIVNCALKDAGVTFLGLEKSSIAWQDVLKEVTQNDVVIIPAFGATVKVMSLLADKGIDPHVYNTTCPFVEKVWRCSEKIGKRGFTIAIHGKALHEETLATFSRARQYAPVVLLADATDAMFIIDFLKKHYSVEDFWQRFKERTSKNFDPEKDLQHIGVVHQTTMLASETEKITEILKNGLSRLYGKENLSLHLADTRDTLCYATSDNQKSTFNLIHNGLDLMLVVGGYNSSNTSHLVEMCKKYIPSIPTYYIKDAKELISTDIIRHYSLKAKKLKTTKSWLRNNNQSSHGLTIGVTAGASCPDMVVENVIKKLHSFHKGAKPLELLAHEFSNR